MYLLLGVLFGTSACRSVSLRDCVIARLLAGHPVQWVTVTKRDATKKGNGLSIEPELFLDVPSALVKPSQSLRSAMDIHSKRLRATPTPS